MQPITFPVSREEPHENWREVVTNLHQAILFLLLNEPAQFTFAGSDNAIDLSQQLRQEYAEGVYGTATEEALKAFQRTSELDEIGTVDELTAFSMNMVLLRWVLSCGPFERLEARLDQEKESATSKGRSSFG